MLLRSLGHVACLTRSLERFVAFYEDVFGADAERFDGVHAVVRMGDATVLHVFERPEDDEPAFGAGPRGRLAFEMTDEDAFLAVRDRLVRRGAAAGPDADAGSIARLRFRDPDGAVHELSLWRTADWSPRFATAPR